MNIQVPLHRCRVTLIVPVDRVFTRLSTRSFARSSTRPFTRPSTRSSIRPLYRTLSVRPSTRLLESPVSKGCTHHCVQAEPDNFLHSTRCHPVRLPNVAAANCRITLNFWREQQFGALVDSSIGCAAFLDTDAALYHNAVTAANLCSKAELSLITL